MFPLTLFSSPFAANGLPELPKRIVQMQSDHEINLFCAHRLHCKVWYANPASSYLSCPNQKNHRCGLYRKSFLYLLLRRVLNSFVVKIDDIHAPLLKEYRDSQTKSSGPYPSPPASRKRPSMNSETNTTPTKRQKKSLKVPNSPALSTNAAATSSPPSPDFPKGTYFTSPPLELKGPLLPDANDDGVYLYLLKAGEWVVHLFYIEIVSFFTDLTDATVGMKGMLIYDESSRRYITYISTAPYERIFCRNVCWDFYAPPYR